MSKSKITISIRTVADITECKFGHKFMEILCGCDDRLTPQQVSLSESYKDPFISFEEFATKWWAVHAEMRFGNSAPSESFWGPFWRRTLAIRSSGHIDHGFINKKGTVIPTSIYFDSQWRQKVDFFSLFLSWSQLVEPEIAMLHLFTEKEQVKSSMSDPRSKFQRGNFGGAKSPGVPNMAWAMAYGGKYLTQIDVSGIRSAGFKVSDHDAGIVVQVTNKLSDVEEDFDYFSRKRKELKSYFPSDFFKIKN